MKTFDQETESDCMRACVYVLLQENIDLPHPVNGQSWNFEFFDEIETRTGKDLIYHRHEEDTFPDFVIRCGMGPRGHRHAIVWHRPSGTIFHDPHRDRSGLLTFDGWYVLK